jgi:hypothetical protein
LLEGVEEPGVGLGDAGGADRRKLPLVKAFCRAALEPSPRARRATLSVALLTLRCGPRHRR